MRTLLKTEELVKERSRESYSQIANLLADLREALGGTDKKNLAENHAFRLRRRNPTLRILVSELRSKGFLKETS